MSNRNRRLCSLLLCAALLLLMPSAALTADAGVTASVTIGTGLAAKPAAEVEARWDSGWFMEKASVYRRELALTAMALSGAPIQPALYGITGHPLPILRIIEPRLGEIDIQHRIVGMPSKDSRRKIPVVVVQNEFHRKTSRKIICTVRTFRCRQRHNMQETS